MYTTPMRIDGKQIRDKIKRELNDEIVSFTKKPYLVVISVGENPVIRSFVNSKKRFAVEIGVMFTENIFFNDASFLVIQKRIDELNEDTSVTGIIIQLPLPAHLDTDKILNLISLSKDVDMIASKSVEDFQKNTSIILPPVVGAINEICSVGGVVIRGCKALVIGHGRLVGAPATVWLHSQGAEVVVVDKYVENLVNYTLEADIIISGAGVAGLIKPEMLKLGVALIDAGTSEEGGLIVGDADPSCEKVASIFTPVPGGVGPVTVAMIFKNLLVLHKRKSN